MNLDDKQKKTVAAWIAEGLKLSDIQKRMSSDLGLSLTYMDVRLLVDDLKLVPHDPPPKTDKPLVAPETKDSGQTPVPGSKDARKPHAPVPGAGKVTVNVDTVSRPGAMVSGSVSFSDGQSATWYVDQFGRLGISPKQQGYKPSAPDLQAFQQTLEAELSKLGL
jgi:hypothetical protein